MAVPVKVNIKSNCWDDDSEVSLTYLLQCSIACAINTERNFFLSGILSSVRSHHGFSGYSVTEKVSKQWIETSNITSSRLCQDYILYYFTMY